MKSVYGQQFDSNPEKIINPTGSLKQYTDLDPYLKGLIDKHKVALDNLEKTKNNVNLSEKYKDRHDLQNKIYLANQQIDSLTKASQEENVSLKDMMQIQNKLKEANDARARLMAKAKIIGGIGLIRKFL